MKKILFNSLIAISFCSSISQSKAQCSFDPAGTTSVSTTSSLSDMAIAPDNKIYTIANNTTSNNIQLKSAFTASSSWTLNATISTTTSVKPIIKIRNDGKIYVFITDGINGNVGKVYSSTGGTFTQLGAAVSAGAVSDLSIAFNSIGEEYIAYTDGANSDRSTVKKWDGSAWANVGSTGLASSSNGYFNSLALDNTDNPIIAFRDFAAGYKISVMKLSGANWVAVTGTGTVSINGATNSVLKVANNGNYYLGYTDNTDAAIVHIYNGSSWTQLGNPVSGLLSTANSFDFDLDPTDVPYFTGILNTSYYPTAYKYVGVPTWTTVATGYINSATSSNSTMDIDNSGTPFFSYADVPGNNALNVKTLASPISISTQPLSTQQICDGSMGSFNIVVGGGVPTSYQWQNMASGTFTNSGTPYSNSTTSSLSFAANLSINQNKIRCVVNVGCKNIISNTSTLTVSSTPIINLSTINPNCFGSADGSITSIVSGGTPTYIYSWNSGDVTANIFSKPAGTYSLNVTDANGCIGSASTNLISPSAISSSISGNLTICNGSSTTLTLTSAGGTPGYTYSWTPGASLNTTTSAVVVATPTATQIYTATVTDINGCFNLTTTTVTVNPLPAVSAGADNAICTGGLATNSATGAHTYTWNPGNFVGANQNVFPVSNTTYTVIGTNTLTGCSSSDFKMVTVNPNPTVTAVSTSTAICEGSTATLTASGAVSYTWNPGALTGATVAVTPTASIIYSVTGTATTGCTNTKTLSLTVNSNPTITTISNPSAICAGSSATLTASGATTYTWNTGQTTGIISVSPSSTTVFTVTGSIGNCTNTKIVSLTVNPNPVATASNSGPLTCTTVTVALNSGSVAGGTYLWSGPGITGPTTTQNTTANIAGNYTVVVTDSGTGCSSNAVTSVIQNTTAPSPTATNSGTLTCNTTSVTLSGSPGTGVTYLWSGPGITGGTTTQNTTANAAGNYTLLVTSSVNGCTNTAVTSVTQNTVAPSILTATSGTLTCSVTTVTISVNLAGLTYLWSGPGITGSTTTQNTTANAPGNYTLTVTSPTNGCTKSATTTVNQNITAPTGVSAGSNQTLTCSSSSVSLNGSIATPTDAIVNWTGTNVCGSPTNVITSACSAGTYTLSATDPINGCTATSTVQVFVDAAIPTVSTSVSNTLTCSNTNATISATTTLTPVIYSWSTGGSTANEIVNFAGVYSVTVTNTSNGCLSISNVSVYQDITIPTISVTASPSTICSGNSTTLTAGGSASVDFIWNPGNLNGAIQNVSPLSTTVYTVVATNTINGCAGTETTSVMVNPNPIINITGNTNICKGSTTNLTASGAIFYTWNTGENTASISITPSITTSYTVTGDNGTGCSNSSTTIITVISSKSISGTITSTAGATTGDVILYKYTAALSKWDSIAVSSFSGSYSFSNIDSALYVVRAIPTATNIQITYGTSSTSWQDATVITHGCSNNSNQDITLIPFGTFIPGPGVLTGTVTQASGFGQRLGNQFKPMAPGQPIGGIIVKGGRNPGGQMLVQTETDAAGQYTLTGLPLNSGDEYFIFVDIPGLDTNGTYHVIIASGDTQIDGLNFTVDSIYINPIGNVTAISQEESILDNKILMFPNPAKQSVSIKYELIQSANVQIELYDVIGNKVKDITSLTHQEKNKYNHSINLENLSSGIYFVKLKINNSESTMKLIINE